MANSRLDVDQGLARIRQYVAPVAAEQIAVGDAFGTVTAAPIIAMRTVPSFRSAAMDGYALRASDTAGASAAHPRALPLGDEVAAGTSPPPLASGSACPISTGAPIPDGADAIVMLEHAERVTDAVGDRVVIAAPVRSGSNIREVGEDMVAGGSVLPPGTLVTPDVMAGLAASGTGSILARRVPGLALVITGSELAEATDGPSAARIPDSNGPMIAAYAASIGSRTVSFDIVSDEGRMIDGALRGALATEAGMIVASGGASHGKYDLMREALERLGGTIVFHGLAMRPGKPILFALLPDGRPFFGLPGNPVSACIGMRFFVAQAFRAMLGLPEETGSHAVSENPGRDGTTLFLRGRLQSAIDGRLSVDTGLDQRSHILSSLLAADTWLRVDRVDGRTRCVAFPKRLSL